MEEPEQEQEQRAGELAADEAAEATHEAAHVAVSSQDVEPASPPIAEQRKPSTQGDSKAGKEDEGAAPHHPPAASVVEEEEAGMSRRTYEKPWLSEKGLASMRKRQAKEKARDVQDFESRLAAIYHGMDDPDGTNAQVDAILSQTSTTKQIKRAQLHDEWQTEVFDKIQSQVETYVETLDVKALEHALLDRSNAYCATVNSRGVFREVLDPNTYDPFDNPAGQCRVSTGGLRDPLHRDLDKDAYERRLLRTAGCSYPTEPPPLGPGMSRLPPGDWLGETLRESRHGRHHNNKGEVEMKLAHTTGVARTASLQGSVVLDHYGFPRDNGATATDFPSGGKAPVLGADRNGGNVGAILARGEELVSPSKGERTGDTWLEMRGKGRPASYGLAAARPRHMFETLSGHDEPSRPPRGALGDAWLEMRGKKVTEAMSSGHPKELFMVLSHGGADSGIPVRDAWISTKGRRVYPPSSTAGMLYINPTPPSPSAPA